MIFLSLATSTPKQPLRIIHFHSTVNNSVAGLLMFDAYSTNIQQVTISDLLYSAKTCKLYLQSFITIFLNVPQFKKDSLKDIAKVTQVYTQTKATINLSAFLKKCNKLLSGLNSKVKIIYTMES